MQIETKKMIDFLNKGNVDVEGGKLVFDKDMLKLTTVACDQTTFFEGGIKKDVIKDYSPGKVYCIKDVRLIIPMFKRMGKDTTMTIDENNTIVLCSGNKKIMSKVADKDLIDDIPELNFKYDFKTKIKTTDIKDILKDASIFSSTSMPVIEITITGNKIITKITENDDIIENTINIDDKAEVDITIKFGVDILNKVIETLTAEYVTLHVKTDYPMQIEENVGNYNINKWYIAPRIE